MTGRTIGIYSRFYADGYDLSGDTVSFGPLDIDYEYSAKAGLTWAVKGSLLGKAELTIGTLNGVFNSDTAGIHNVVKTKKPRDVMIPLGMRAVPVAGDPTWIGRFNQTGYGTAFGEVMPTVTVPFGGQENFTTMKYADPWGVLLHAKASRNGANASTTGVNNGAASALGGYLMYQIFSITGTGNATISIDDSADGTTYAALSGATSGAIANTAAPTSGIVQLAINATVKQYLRWQLSLTGATACEFALAFVRG